MPTSKLIKKKDGTRWIKYKGKKYRIDSDASDNDLIDNIVEIIRLLTVKRRKRAKKNKSLSGSNITAETNGFSNAALDNIALNNFRRDAATTEVKTVLALPAPPPAIMIEGVPIPPPPPKNTRPRPPAGFVEVIYPNGIIKTISIAEANTLANSARAVTEEYKNKIMAHTKKWLTSGNSNFARHFSDAFPNFKTIIVDGEEYPFTITGAGQVTYINDDGKKIYATKSSDIIAKLTLADYIQAAEYIKTVDTIFRDNFPIDPNEESFMEYLPDDAGIAAAEGVGGLEAIGDNPPTEEEIAAGQALNDQQAQGAAVIDGGLFGSDIIKLMGDVTGFLGVYALDQIKNIKQDSTSPMQSFIYNTSPISEPNGHWIAVVLTPKTVEHFDSLAQDPSDAAYSAIKDVVGSCPQFKINNVKFQSSKSSDCGYFAMKFIKDRLSGKSWKHCSGWEIVEKSMEGQKNIEKFKSSLREFRPL
jgi:hypothetical protein